MNIAIYLEPETKQDFECIMKSYEEYNSLYSCKDSISLRFKLDEASRFITFIQRLQEWCVPKTVQRQCKAVCKNGSDCFNSAQFKGYCWKHSRWIHKKKGNKELRGDH